MFRVLSDGRKYIANIRTDNWITGGQSHDVWQAFLFARYNFQEFFYYIAKTDKEALNCRSELDGGVKPSH